MMKAKQKRVAVYPVGTIRIRKGEGSRGNQRCRMIKVRMDGPIGRRWIAYSRYLWELRYGPVPPGMVVGRLDGNMMNDAIGNLKLMTMGDVVGLAHIRDPTMSKKNYEKASKATARMNKERAHVRRAMEYLPSKWYAVFPTIGLVWNNPQRKRNQLYREVGIDDKTELGHSASLGFANHQLLQACCLLIGAADSLQEMTKRVNELRAYAGWNAVGVGPVCAALSYLKHAGLMEGKHNEYRLSSMVDVVRTRKTPVLAVKGEQLINDPLFKDFKRSWEIKGVCIKCGCHDHHACLDENGIGCHWISPGLCSQCQKLEGK